MSRDSYWQGVDDAQHYGKPNSGLSEDPDYMDGFDGHMKEDPLVRKSWLELFAQVYCLPRNSKKVVDPDLLEDVVDVILKEK